MMMNALYYPPPEDEEWPDLYYGPKLSLCIEMVAR